MGQDKKQLTKLLAFVKELYDNPDNKEFAAGIQAIVAADTKAAKDARFDEIYEYCIEKNAKKQAEAVYSKFPIREIARELSADYWRMESFKRRGDFLNYAAELFKQIERIANHICNMPQYNQAFDRLKDTPAFIIYNHNPISIHSRNSGSTSVSQLLFSTFNMTKEGKDKRSIPIDQQYILDKIKIALYFGGYATCMFSSSELNKFSFSIANIYQVRCEADHGLTRRTAKQETAFQDIMKEPDFYYSEFSKALHFFIDKISDGYCRRQEVFDYSSNAAMNEVTLLGYVYNALPGALYIKCENSKSELAPPNSYNHTVRFENGMKVQVTKKSGTIIQVIPKES